MSSAFETFESDLSAMATLLRSMRPCSEARATTVWLIRELAGSELGSMEIGDTQIRALLRAVYPGVKGNDPGIVPGWAVVCELLRSLARNVGGRQAGTIEIAGAGQSSRIPS